MTEASKQKRQKQLLDLGRRLRTPLKVQKYLRTFKYNHEPNGPELKSAWKTLKLKRTSKSVSIHCYEAVFLAAALLESQGLPPLVLSLESQDDLDHVLYVYKKNGRWGSIGFSRDPGLLGRKPVFRSIRDLVYSYLDPYVDKTGRITGYAVCHLDETGADWRLSEKSVWKAERYLIDYPHKKLKSSQIRYKKALRLYLRNGDHPAKSSWI